MVGGADLARPSPRPLAAPHLQQHVARLDAAVGGHSPALHDGADVDAAIAPVVALAHDADAQEMVPLCGAGCVNKRPPAPEPRAPLAAAAAEASPMLSVTVMMFSDMVESVMLLKEEACGGGPG